MSFLYINNVRCFYTYMYIICLFGLFFMDVCIGECYWWVGSDILDVIRDKFDKHRRIPKKEAETEVGVKPGKARKHGTTGRTTP